MLNERERIEIDFAKAMERADELEAIAREMTELAKGDVSGTLAVLSKGFGGENGEAFLKKSETLAPQLLKTAEQMLKTAANIRFTAEVIYRAEKRAQILF